MEVIAVERELRSGEEGGGCQALAGCIFCLLPFLSIVFRIQAREGGKRVRSKDSRVCRAYPEGRNRFVFVLLRVR